MTASLSLAEPRLNGSASTNTLPTIQPIQVRDRVHPEAHMLFWQYHGTSTIIANDKPTGLCAKQALWLPAEMRHDIEVDANSVLLRIFFGVKSLAIAPEMASPRIFHVDQELAGNLMGLVQSGDSLLQSSRGLDQYVLDQLSMQLRTVPWPESPAAKEIAQMLNDDPGDPRTLHQLAASVHASPRTIERAFLTETGETFQEWRMQSRIARAKQLIADGLPIDAVALRVGYSTASAFGRAFKKRTGLSPSGYFNEHVENYPRN